jgi:hypothetical protein
MEMPPLMTGRLLVRPFAEDDLPELLAVLQVTDAGVARLPSVTFDTLR